MNCFDYFLFVYVVRVTVDDMCVSSLLIIMNLLSINQSNSFIK